MKRVVSQTRIGTSQVRYRTRIEDEYTPKGSLEARGALYVLFQAMIDRPDLLYCGMHAPQTISFKHNGSGWVIEAEAIAEEE